MFFLPGAQESLALPPCTSLLIHGAYPHSSPMHLCISHLREVDARSTEAEKLLCSSGIPLEEVKRSWVDQVEEQLKKPLREWLIELCFVLIRIQVSRKRREKRLSMSFYSSMENSTKSA